MENLEAPSRLDNFAERFKKIGGRILEFAAARFIVIPNEHREHPSFRGHLQKLDTEVGATEYSLQDNNHTAGIPGTADSST